VGQLGAYWQEAFDQASRLYASKPDVILLAVQTREIAPELWDGFAALGRGEREAVVERVVSQLRGLMETIRGRCAAPLIVHVLEKPVHEAMGVLDAQRGDGQQAAIEEINRRLVSLARAIPGAYVLDYDALVARYGRETWHDAVKWSAVNVPMRSE
jgi:predicted enzyme involved in methoxymalonyl-ACP biosynthesis